MTSRIRSPCPLSAHLRARSPQEGGQPSGELEPGAPATQLDLPVPGPPVSPADSPVHLVESGGRYGLRVALPVSEQDRATVELDKPLLERQLNQEPRLIPSDRVQVVAKESLPVDRTDAVKALPDRLGD